jgi:hypothetical protein
MLQHVRLDRLAAALLLSLDEHPHINGQRTLAGVHQGFECFDQRVHLAFVVHRAAGIEILVADLRLEGGAGPQLDGINRLHVVVAVE